MNSQERLAALRAIATKEGGTWRDHLNTWRDEGKRGPNYTYNPELEPARAFGFKHCRWIESTRNAGLRFAGFADEIIQLRHKGWFADSFQDETFRGAVYQLPGRDGRAVYVYGYNDPNNDGAAFLSFDSCDDKEEAARSADSLAENFAEDARECSAKDNAEAQIDELRDEIVSLRQEARALSREIKAAGANFTPNICAVLRDKLRTIRADSHRAHKRIRALSDNYWLAVE